MAKISAYGDSEYARVSRVDHLENGRTCKTTEVLTERARVLRKFTWTGGGQPHHTTPYKLRGHLRAEMPKGCWVALKVDDGWTLESKREE